MKNIFILLFIFTGFYYSAQAQEMRIEMSLDRDSMLIGDQVEMTLRIAYDPGTNFEFPTIGDTLMPDIEVVRQSKLDTLQKKKGDGLLEVERRYTLTCFEAGVIYPLPRFQFVVYKNGEFDTISSNQLMLKVAYPPMDSTWKPNDIKPPVEYPITVAEAAPYVLGGLLLVALIVFLVYFLNKRKKNQPLFFKPKPKEPAHIIALRNLQSLKDEKLWQQGKVKDFHTKISEIIRVYIEDRFAIPAMEHTSDEILLNFESQSTCSKEDLAVLREVFYFSDLVKFAKFTPAPDENEGCFQRTQQFVEKTKLRQTVVNDK